MNSMVFLTKQDCIGHQSALNPISAEIQVFATNIPTGMLFKSFLVKNRLEIASQITGE